MAVCVHDYIIHVALIATSHVSLITIASNLVITESHWCYLILLLFLQQNSMGMMATQNVATTEFLFKITIMFCSELVHIRESVDSLCRDGADAQYMQYLSKSRITSPQTR